MSRARVDEIVDRLGTGPVEFPQGLTVSSGKITRVLGPFRASGDAAGTQGQILRAGPSGELIWGDSVDSQLDVQDGTTAGDVKLELTSGQVTTVATLRGGNNVSLIRSGDLITVNASYTDTDTITRLKGGSSGTPVSGDINLLVSGSATISQNGQNITIGATNTEYTAGTGVTLTGTVFSIPQEVGAADSPTFNALTVSNQLTTGSIACTGTITGTWNGNTIPIDKGGTGQTTAAAAFQALAPNITASASKFLTTDGSSIYWANLPSSQGFTQLTYTLSAQDTGTTNQALIRATDSDTNYTQVTLVATDDITINRTGNTISIGSTNAQDTTLTAEEVQDIVGNMIDSTANQNINVSYNDIANRLEFEVPAANFVDTNHTYDFSSVAITGGVSLKLTPGGSGAGESEDVISITGGNNVTIARDSGTGLVTISSTDTDVDTVTRLRVDGPSTTGGAFFAGDISIQASGAITLAQSGGTLSIGSTDTNEYVDGVSWSAINGNLVLTRSGSLADITLPITNLQTYFDSVYATQAGLIDTKITSASFNASSGNLVLTTNGNPSTSVTVNLDGRYAQDTGPNIYVNAGAFGSPTNTAAGQDSNRKNLKLTRSDSAVVEIETTPFIQYFDTKYAPISSVDTSVTSFTFNSGSLQMNVGTQASPQLDQYTINLDGRYVRGNTYTTDLSFDTNTGVLSLDQEANGDGNAVTKGDLTVDLDGRYKLITAVDEKISELIWDKNNGNLKAKTNTGSNTPNENLDGRYFKGASLNTTNANPVLTLERGGGSANVTVQFPQARIDVPDGTKLLCYQAAAPSGYVKETTHNNKALRVVTGNGGGSGGNKAFTTVFSSGKSTGGSVARGNLAVGGDLAVRFSNSGNISANHNLGGNFSGSISSTANVNHNLTGNRGNLGISGSGLNTGQLASHRHNYQRPTFNGKADTDNGKLSRGKYGTNTGATGSGSGHGHGMNGSPGISGNINIRNQPVSGSVGINGNVSVNDNRTIIANDNFTVSGNPSFSQGSLDLDVRYVDVIICRRDPSAG